MVTPEQFRSYYKFTIVRNPWARAYSWYRNVVRDPKHLKAHKMSAELSFAEFMVLYAGKGMLKPQTYWLKRFNGQIVLDFIGQFETLDEDYKTARLSLAGDAPASLPHEIKGKHSGYRSAYDDQTRDLVARVYAEEIALFGYRFE